MKKNMYLESLALLGVGGAHPGGLQLTKHILDRKNLDAKMSILDAGCGTGQTAAYIAEKYHCHVTAVDYNKMMLDKARDRFSSLKLPIKTKLGSTEDLPFSEAVFDMVISESVIAFTNSAQTIQEFKRVLKPSGMLYAVEMVLENNELSEREMKEIKEFYGVQKLLTESNWIKAFHDGRFQEIDIEKFNFDIDSQNLENAPDFAPSTKIKDEYFEVLEAHENFIKVYKDILGFRIFTCFP